MPLSTTIKKTAYDMKMKDAAANHGLFIEYKEDKPFWKRIENQEYPTTITFLIGSKPVKHLALGYKKILWVHMPMRYREFFKPGTQWFYELQCLELTKDLQTIIGNQDL